MLKSAKNKVSARRLLADAQRYIEDEDFFCSSSFIHHFESMAAIHTSRYSYQYRIRVEMDWLEQKQAELACTNNERVYINAGHPIITKRLARNQRYLFILGLFAHELGHILFTDFPQWSLFRQTVLDGQWVPHSDKVVLSSQAKQSVKEILSFMKADPTHNHIIAQVLQSLLNILEDAYIELCMMKKFPGIFGQSLVYIRTNYFAKQSSLTEQLNLGLSNATIASNLLLYYVRFHTLPLGQESDLHPCVQALTPCLQVVYNAIKGNLSDRCEAAGMLLVHLWPLISSTKNDTSILEILQQLCSDSQTSDQLKRAPVTAIPTGNTKPVDRLLLDENDAKRALDGTLLSESACNSSNPHEVNKIFDQITAGILESKRLCDLNEEVSQMDLGTLHDKIDINIHRACDIDPDMIVSYERISAPLLPLSRRLQKELARELKKRKYPQRFSGYAFGKQLDPRHLYRTDGKIFTKTIPAKPDLDMAVALLLDESGSMYTDDRYKYAQATAVVVQDFCHHLNIPLMLYGHSTTSNVVDLYSYCEFDRISDTDKYRLVHIQARSTNRDGAALRYVGRQLLSRSEQMKLLILVSDGQPNHGKYKGDLAKNDLRQFKQDFVKQGGLFIAAAIGDDQNIIHQIYGNCFLDLSNLESLPLQLVQYLKQNIRL